MQLKRAKIRLIRDTWILELLELQQFELQLVEIPLGNLAPRGAAFVSLFDRRRGLR